MDRIADSKRKPIRVGFILDIVSYSQRDTPAKKSLQQRLARVVQDVLDDVRVAHSYADHQGTGDGQLVILPEWVDLQRVVPALLRSMADRLAQNNAVFQDRMRVRMAADVGPVRGAELGFEGAMVTDMARLLNSEPLRRWVVEHSERDLSMIMSDSLHRFVVAEGTPELPKTQFTQVDVQVNATVSTAWLWTC